MYHHQEQKCQISLHFQQCFIFLKQLPLANFHRILMDISWTLESSCPPWNKCHNTAIFRFVNLVLLEWPKPRSGKPLPHLWRSGPRWTVDWGFDGICSSSARNSVDICSTIESASGFMAIPLVVKQHQLGPQLHIAKHVKDKCLKEDYWFIWDLYIYLSTVLEGTSA